MPLRGMFPTVEMLSYPEVPPLQQSQSTVLTRVAFLMPIAPLADLNGLRAAEAERERDSITTKVVDRAAIYKRMQLKATPERCGCRQVHVKMNETSNVHNPSAAAFT